MRMLQKARRPKPRLSGANGRFSADSILLRVCATKTHREAQKMVEG